MKTWINNNLDKITHFFASGWIFLVLMLIFNDLDIGIMASVVIFIGKEIYDQFWGGTGFNIKDALASFLGVVTSLIIWSIFNI